MLDISILTASDEPLWQAYVDSHPEATIYHTLAWRDILYNEYRFEPVYLLAREREKNVGILPMFLVKNLRGMRLVSLPFSIYGGPIGDSGEIVSALLSKAKEMIMRGVAGSIESKCMPVGIEELGSASEEKGMKVDLTISVDGLWKQLTDRNDVNRAIREGLKFSLSDGDGIEKFYQLQLMTRKRLGLPTPSLRYYRSFFERMPGMVKLALVKKGDTPIAGGIFFAYKGSILYALGASEQKYLYCRPNDMLIWEMIKWGCDNGFNILDLGPTPFSDKGLMHFKAKWGGRTIPVNEYIFPSYNEGRKTVNKMASSLFEVLPVNLARHVGHHVIRAMG